MAVGDEPDAWNPGSLAAHGRDWRVRERQDRGQTPAVAWTAVAGGDGEIGSGL